MINQSIIQFTYKLLSEHLRPKTREHPFDIICDEHNINHKLTQFRHPWTNGQVEIMNKTLKDNTTKKYHYDNIEQLKDHMNSYIYYYNYERKLKSLSFKSPYDRIKKEYEDNPQYFYTKPVYKLEELNNYQTIV